MSQQRRKIFDIVPPAERLKERDIVPPAERVKERVVGLSKLQKERIQKTGAKRFFPARYPFSKKAAVSLTLVALVFFLAVGAYARLVEVRVRIRPVMEKWDFQEEITVATGLQGIDLAAKAIPGVFVEDSKELSRQFSASGKTTQATKAYGTVRVYNKYSLPQVLVANTRFLSDEGKLFRSKSRVVIPPGSSQDVEVVAAEAGEEYNIGPSTFSIPGLAGSPRYTAVYGESKEPMRGGSQSAVPEVTEDDIKKAKDELSNALLQEGRSALLAKVGGEDTILLEGAFLQEVEELESTVGRGAQVAYFQVKGRVKSKALVFSRKNIEEFWQQFVSRHLPEGKSLSPVGIREEFSFRSIDWEQRRMNLQSSASAFAYNKINLQELQERLKGASVESGRKLLGEMPGVAEVDLKMWPLPWGRIPKNINKIKIFLDFTPPS